MRFELETDVCIVGAGPAGLVLAAELVEHGMDVLVLESAADSRDPVAQTLNQGTVVGDPYAGLAATRHRAVGGTAAIWNTVAGGDIMAKCVPLDPHDFGPHAGSPLSGWPFGFSELAPYYARAGARCGLRAASFDTDDPGATDRRAVDGFPSPVVSKVYRLASRAALLEPCLAAVRSCTHAELRCDSTVLSLETSSGGRRVSGVVIGARDGSRRRIAARRFVLATGAIENARLLLVSASGPDGLRTESDRVGRCFMEHPRDASLRLTPRYADFYRSAAFYDLHRGPDGAWTLGRLGLDPEWLAARDLPNVSGTLLPRVRPGIRRIARGLGRARRLPLLRTLAPTGGHGWSDHPLPGLAFDGFTLLFNLEMTPHPENRILLGSGTDAFGVARPELCWRWRPEDEARRTAVRRAFAESLEASGLVEVTVDGGVGIDPNAHHHAGTTRMATDPDLGVVDPDLRVHGIDNLYVAGASTFPTAGYANPLLTILALSVRLADHLARTR